MRAPVDAARIRQLMEALARAADRELRIYMVGGTTAVLMGWRSSTIDVDLVMRPEDDALLRAIPVGRAGTRASAGCRRRPRDDAGELGGHHWPTPLWSHRGEELFYLDAQSNLVAARLTTTPSLVVQSTRVLFNASDFVQTSVSRRNYDVAADDQRFLMVLA